MPRLVHLLFLGLCLLTLTACSQGTANNVTGAQEVYPPQPHGTPWAEPGPKYVIDGKIVSAEEKEALEKKQK